LWKRKQHHQGNCIVSAMQRSGYDNLEAKE